MFGMEPRIGAIHPEEAKRVTTTAGIAVEVSGVYSRTGIFDTRIWYQIFKIRKTM